MSSLKDYLISHDLEILDLYDLNLGQLYQILREQDQNRVLKLGFANPHSYRGNYVDIAFSPVKHITIRKMTYYVETSILRWFDGWKGGSFEMTENTAVYLAHEGHSGERLGKLLMDFILK